MKNTDLEKLLIQKLTQIFSNPVYDEANILYLLITVRRYIEFCNLKEKYGYLKFYCNWALHAQIDDTKIINDEIEGIVDGDVSNLHSILDEFFNELGKFIVELRLSKEIIENSNSLKLRNILIEIYSYTPIIYVQKWYITLRKNGSRKLKNEISSIDFVIQPPSLKKEEGKIR